jgi:hypothetical protein
VPQILKEGVQGLVEREQDWRVNVDRDSLGAFAQVGAASPMLAK